MQQKYIELIEEYKMIRQEIDDKMKQQDNLATWSIPAITAFVGFGISYYKNNNYMFVFIIAAMIITVAMSLKLQSNRKSIAKLAAYLVVFVEPEIQNIKWETRNYIYEVGSKKSTSFKIWKSYEYITIMVALCFLYYILFFINKPEEEIIFIIGSIVPVILIIAELFVLLFSGNITKQKKIWTDRWIYIKNGK